jgi:hypothetical protein
VSAPSPGARAVAAYKIEDVFLVAAECWVSRDNNQGAQPTEITYGHFSSVDETVMHLERTSILDGKKLYILRYFVIADVRLLKPGVSVENRDPTQEELLAGIKLTFATDYSCSPEALQDTDALGAFSRNAQFHAWPYIREEVSAFCGRLRIPRVMLPMLKPDQPWPVRIASGPEQEQKE